MNCRKLCIRAPNCSGLVFERDGVIIPQRISASVCGVSESVSDYQSKSAFRETKQFLPSYRFPYELITV